MATITLRQAKGSPLTNAEVDANFTNINNEVALKLDTADFTGANILTKLKTVDGENTGLDADKLDGLEQSPTIPGTTDKSSIVSRDSDGNIEVAQITASYVTATGGSFSGNAAITSGSITGITDLAVADGGTGASTATGARTNLGLAIGSNVQAYSATLDAVSAADASAADKLIYTEDDGEGNITFTTATVTSKARELLDDTSALAMRNTLGLTIGSNVQAYDADLAALASNTTNGMIAKTGSGTVSSRTITGSTGISVTNGNGVNGNPTITNTGVTSINGQTGAISGLSGATGGGDDQVFMENDNQITANYTIGTNKNAVTAGPVEILNNVTITVPIGSVWTIV
jgi:hypothetical protein